MFEINNASNYLLYVSNKINKMRHSYGKAVIGQNTLIVGVFLHLYSGAITFWGRGGGGGRQFAVHLDLP